MHHAGPAQRKAVTLLLLVFFLALAVAPCLARASGNRGAFAQTRTQPVSSSVSSAL